MQALYAVHPFTSSSLFGMCVFLAQNNMYIMNLMKENPGGFVAGSKLMIYYICKK